MVGCSHYRAPSVRGQVFVLAVGAVHVCVIAVLGCPVVFFLDNRRRIIETRYSILGWMDPSAALEGYRYRLGRHFSNPAIDDIVF
jgi:hypothetical protein